MTDTIKTLKNMKNRLLGIDYGERFVGVAVCDLTWLIASPYQTIDLRSQPLLPTLERIINQEAIAAIIVGNPLNMNGSQGERSLKCTRIAQELQEALTVPVVLWDERWSSQAVERGMLEADLSRTKRKENVDKLAASYILQGFLDFLR